MLYGDIWVDFVPVTHPETKEDVVGGDGNSQRSCQDKKTVIELVDDQVDPGEEFFVIHLELMGT